jgi:lipopolysaccharide transport system permease protein
MSEIVIKAGRQSIQFFLRDLYNYRELLWILARKDIKVRYVQTFLGFLWAIINPLITVLILSFVFGKVAKVETGSIPHIVYTIAGLCGWAYFSEVVTSAGNSLLQAQHLIKKIYFPRLIIPLSKAIVALVDLVVLLIILCIMMVVYRVSPGSHIVYLPIFILIAILSGLTGGIWISALSIRFRDFQYIIPIVLRLGMFLTPIAYSYSTVPEKYSLLFYLNPMAGVVEGFRWSLIGTEPPDTYFLLSYFMIFVFFILGIFYFKHVERTIADYI